MKNKQRNKAFNPIDILSMANAKPRGKRPHYFDDAMAEHSFSMIMALMSELAVARERIDTLERVMEEKGFIVKDDIENYVPDDVAGQERQVAQSAYCARVFRSLQQMVQSMGGDDQSMDVMAKTLGETQDD